MATVEIPDDELALLENVADLLDSELLYADERAASQTRSDMTYWYMMWHATPDELREYGRREYERLYGGQA